MNIIYSDFKEQWGNIFFYNTVNFQPVTFRILFFRGIQTLQMRLSRKACFWWTQLTKALLPGSRRLVSYWNGLEWACYMTLYIYPCVTPIDACLQNRMDQYFVQIDKIISSKKNPPRIRFLMSDLVDLRRVSPNLLQTHCFVIIICY